MTNFIFIHFRLFQGDTIIENYSINTTSIIPAFFYLVLCIEDENDQNVYRCLTRSVPVIRLLVTYNPILNANT